MPTIAAMLRQATRQLDDAGVDAPRRSAELLAAHCFDRDRVWLIAHADDAVPPAREAAFHALTARRAQGEPVAYLLGGKEFYGRAFHVTPATLIPRPETELLVERALEALPSSALRFADMGTGSGCIALTLAAERPLWRGLMLDISPQALDVACHNARRLHVAERVPAICGDMTSPPVADSSLDCCISNPPYIAEAERPGISREVLDFEPAGALFSPAEGLGHLAALAGQAARMLRPGGLLLMEHGAGQGAAVHAMLMASPFWRDIKIHKDFAGLDRFCEAWKKV